MNIRGVVVLTVVVLVIGCGRREQRFTEDESKPEPVNTKTSAPAANAKLKASIKRGPKSDDVIVEYRNDTDHDVKINRQVAGNALLSLAVFDAAGERKLSVSPPVPWATTEYLVIPAGETRSFEDSLHMFNPPLAPGKYRVRVRVEGWTSNDYEYVIMGDTP